MKITFFAGSVVGYVDNPTAVMTRGIAHGLALRGNDIRIVEERQNHAFARTLRQAGSQASRHFYDQFRSVQHVTYEPRTGPHLLEWVTREVALIDAAIAVDGVETELCRWLANVSRAGLVRAFLTWDPATLTPERVNELELEKFDFILSPSDLAVELPSRRIEPTVARQDLEAGIGVSIVAGREPDPIAAARIFEIAIGNRGGI